MEHFYERNAGHLVVISSVSAMRGMPGSITAYAATKAGVAHLAEGIRSDLIEAQGPRHQGHHPVPGLHRVGDERGCRAGDPPDGRHRDRLQAMVKAIEREVAEAAVRRGRGRRSARS